MSQIIPLKSYAQFFPPGVPEENVFTTSASIENTGNEYLLLSGYTIFAKVYDGTNPSISYDYSYGTLKNSLPLGLDFTVSPTQHLVSNIVDPDIAGTIDITTNKARFIVVYAGHENASSTIKAWFEVWELDPNALIPFYQIISPSPLTNAATTEIYSLNVDVSYDKKIAIVYNFEGLGRIKLYDNLFPVNIIDISIGLNYNITLNPGNPLTGNCPTFSDITWLDVAITEDAIVNPCSQVHVVHNFDGNNRVGVASGDFNQIFNIITTMPIGTPLGCKKQPFTYTINASSGTGFYAPFGPSRIAAPSSQLGITALGCDDYAITYAGTQNPSVGYNHIYMQLGNSSGIYFNELVNSGPNTYRCYNGLPVIGYAYETELLTVTWEFFDCNFCIPGNTQCDPGDPASIQQKPGYYILARAYNNIGNRLFPSDISVVSDPSYTYPNATRPSISGRHSEMWTEMLFGYSDNNIITMTYKASNTAFPNLKMPLGLNNIINSEQPFVAYPNPFYEELNLQFDFSDSDFHLNIYDVSGKLVKQQYLKNVPKNELKINTAMLNKGIYFLEIKTKQKVFNQKITKLW